MLNISGKIEKDTLHILKTVSEICGKVKLPFFLIGATGRDFIMHYGYDITNLRATTDIDFGIQISIEGDFERFSDLLLKNHFEATKIRHRFNYNGKPAIDVVPFGLQDQIITGLSTDGYLEVFNAALDIKIDNNPELIIKSASLTGLIILKFIAWNDRPSQRGNDADDIYCIIKHYAECGNEEAFYDSEDLFEGDHDYEYSSARFVGRNINRIVNTDTKNKLIQIIDCEINKDDSLFISQMLKSTCIPGWELERKTEHCKNILLGLKQGIEN